MPTSCIFGHKFIDLIIFHIFDSVHYFVTLVQLLKGNDCWMGTTDSLRLWRCMAHVSVTAESIAFSSIFRVVLVTSFGVNLSVLLQIAWNFPIFFKFIVTSRERIRSGSRRESAIREVNLVM